LVVQQLFVELNCIQFASFDTGENYCLRRLLAQTMKPLIRQLNSLAARFHSMKPSQVKLVTGGTHTSLPAISLTPLDRHDGPEMAANLLLPHVFALMGFTGTAALRHIIPTDHRLIPRLRH
jgi:hypothetical protein